MSRSDARRFAPRTIAGVKFHCAIVGGRIGLVGPFRDKIHLAPLPRNECGQRWVAYALDDPAPRPAVAVGRTQLEVVEKLLAISAAKAAKESAS